jgi:hypothetical protein
MNHKTIREEVEEESQEEEELTTNHEVVEAEDNTREDMIDHLLAQNSISQRQAQETSLKKEKQKTNTSKESKCKAILSNYKKTRKECGAKKWILQTKANTSMLTRILDLLVSI